MTGYSDDLLVELTPAVALAKASGGSSSRNRLASRLGGAPQELIALGLIKMGAFTID